jgi:hypothetical protein
VTRQISENSTPRLVSSVIGRGILKAALRNWLPPTRSGTLKSYFRTHDFNPRFACLSRLLKDLGGHLKSVKLLRLQHNVALKRLASAVQLRPWPPSFKVSVPET